MSRGWSGCRWSAPTAPRSATWSMSCSTASGGGAPPRVNGFVVAVQRRRVFVGAGRVGRDRAGRACGCGAASINLRQFELRAGRAARRRRADRPAAARAQVVDVGDHAGARALRVGARDDRARRRRRCPGRRRAPEIIDWSEAGELFADERPRRPAGRGDRAAAPGRDGRGDPQAAARRAGACSPTRSRTSGSPTCSRSSPRTSRCGSSRASTSTRRRACSTRWRPTTPPTCSASSRPMRRERAARRDGPRGGRAGPPAADLRARHRRRADDARADRARRRRRPSPRRSRGSATPTCRCRSPPRCSSASRRPRPRPAASSASRTSSGCCARRRRKPLGRCLDEEPEPVSADTQRPRGRRAAGRLRRGRAAGASTSRAGCSARSRSTTCSTACCPPAGASRHGGTELMATARRPRASRAGTPGGPQYDPDAFGRFAEGMARYLGTGRYLAIQTVIVIIWIALNVDRGRAAVRPVPVHPAEPGVLDPGRVRRAADPARAEPPGRPRPGRDRARPRDERPRARRRRVPGARDRGAAARDRAQGRPRRHRATRSAS